MSFQPKYDITNSTTNALTIIERARGFLDVATLSETWVAKMQDKALISEAHLTTHIEGTQLTLEQSELLLAGNDLADVDAEDARELLNYKEAFEIVAGYIDDGGPITEVLIRELHKTLVQGVRGNSATPGAYRKIPNYVVNSATKEVIYTPPAANEVPRLMLEMIDWIREAKDINPVIVAGIAQFQLVHIHPFLAGNGRTARLLSTLCLYKAGYDFKRLFSISEYYDRDKVAYYNIIQATRNNNMDLTQWIEYFTTGLSTQMQEIKSAGESVINKDIFLLSAQRQQQLSDRQVSILSLIFEDMKSTLSDIEEQLNLNRRTIQRDIKKLVDLKLIKEVGTSPTDPNKHYEVLS